MNTLKILRTYLLLCGLVITVQIHQGFAQSNSDASITNPRSTIKERDGQKDFDFEIGTWNTQLKRLQNPLSGLTTWVEYEGTTIVRKVWNGRANLVELDVKGSAGRIEALSLRLYDPSSRQWSLNFAGVNDGTLSVPTIGGFKNGRGEFYNQEIFKGKAILVRFIISNINPNSCHFEQAFSDDGGKTWEVNWIATDTRIKDDFIKHALRSIAPWRADNDSRNANLKIKPERRDEFVKFFKTRAVPVQLSTE